MEGNTMKARSLSSGGQLLLSTPSWRNVGSARSGSRKHLKNVNFFGQSYDATKLLKFLHDLSCSEISTAALELLSRTLRSHTLFQGLSAPEFELVVKAFQRQEFAPGATIVQEGTLGDSCYVVESGAARMCEAQGRTSTLTSGSIFGDMGLMDEWIHTASVLADTDVVVWSLSGEVYRKTLAAYSVKQLEETKTALSNVELFSGLSPHQLSLLAQSVKLRSFSAGHRIITKGETGSEMYVIQDGSVRITFHDSHQKVENGEFKAIGSESGDRDSVHEVTLTAIDLGPGAYFGERALLYREPRAAYVTATVDTSCFVVSQNMFNLLLGPLTEVLEINVRLDMLRSLQVFEEIESTQELRLAEAMRISKYRAGDTIITAGTPATEFCIIKSGKVAYRRVARSDDETTTPHSPQKSHRRMNSEMKTLSAGDTFGIEALSGNPEYASTVTALTNVQIFVVTRATVELLDLRLKSSIRGRTASFAGRPSEANCSPFDLDINSPVSDYYSESGELQLNVESTDELEIMRTLGCGSFGRVKLAKHRGSEAVMALKILQKHEVVLMKQQKNIIREKEMLQQLKHPFILKLYGTFQDAHCLYMMLELVRGGELFRLLHGDGSEENALKLYDTRFYCANLLSIYQHIHAKQIVYRDLKPENVLIDEFGYLKLVDWGFAKEVLDKTYTLCGTPEYLAPEAVKGTGHNIAVDYWSLGALTFEMLTGYSPFLGNDADDTMAICHNVVHGTIEFPDGFDEEARSLILALCTQDPIQRLGCLKGGTRDVMDHPFFENIDWDALYLRDLIAPWVPDIKDELDVSHFDDIYDQEPEYIAEFDGNNADFEDF